VFWKKYFGNITRIFDIMNRKTRKNKTSSRVFSEEHFKSGDGMLTTIWGPSAWHFLHTMSFNYPVKPSLEDKKHYRNFVLQLKYVLPCGKCRFNLTKNFKKLPLLMSSMRNRESFSRYVYELHEQVNTMLDKKSGLSYENVKERYEHFRARCKQPTKGTQKNQISKSKIEKGCTEPIYGEKSKCLLHIVPAKTKCKTLKIEKECLQQRVPV
jgi:hypothetical protein